MNAVLNKKANPRRREKARRAEFLRREAAAIAAVPAMKMCLVGDMAVGKTSLAHVFLQQPFKEHYQASIGGVVMSRTLEDPSVTCQVWDTAGMERYRALLPHYMRGAVCAIIIFDVTSKDTFLSVRDYWLDFLDCCGEEGLVKVLVGNKMDVPEGLRVVQTKEAKALAESRGLEYVEASAKFGMNVDEIFTTAARKAKATIPTVVNNSSPNNGSFRLDVQPSRSWCCFGTLHV